MARPTNRPKRVPVGTRNRLTTDNKDPSKVQRWVNDVDNRVQMFEEGGYTKVERPTQVGDPRAGNASQLGKAVRRPVGGGVEAVLMEIDRDLYDEDQTAKQNLVDESEQALMPENIDSNPDQYTGKGVNIHSTRPTMKIST